MVKRIPIVAELEDKNTCYHCGEKNAYLYSNEDNKTCYNCTRPVAWKLPVMDDLKIRPKSILEE